MSPPATAPAPPKPSQGLRNNLAYAAVRDAILQGNYLPGAQLKEESLARQFGFSRTPIKHALSRLVAEGLATQEPCVGVFVRRLTSAEHLDLLFFRRAIESSAAAMAAEALSPQDETDLLALAHTVDDLMARRDYPAVFDAQIAFHRRVLTAAGSREIERAAAHAQIMFFTLTVNAPDSRFLDVTEPMSKSHADVARAIASRSPSLAFQAMWTHFEVSIRRIRAQIAATPGGARDAAIPPPRPTPGDHEHDPLGTARNAQA